MDLLTRIVEVRREAEQINAYRLVNADGSCLPAFSAGAHVDVHVAAGLVRQYSLCNSPLDLEAYEIAVKREPVSRGGSQAVHEQFKVGDFVRISSPRNNFPLHPDATQHLLLGAGIGITPLLSMAKYLASTGTSFHLHYFFRSNEYAAFRDLLTDRPLQENVSLHCGLDQLATQDVLRRLLQQREEGTHAYLCGPQPFITAAIDTASGHWPSETVHKELFQKEVDTPVADQSAFKIRLASSGQEYIVETGQTILQVLDECGVYAARSCEQGFCGTCEMRLLEGNPDHRDDYLTDEEKRSNTKIMPCVSRANGPMLVLDI